MFPSVSVVVPAYNLARFLGRAIDSALAQDWPAEALEVIVVDDGSTDETPQVLAAYGDRIRAIRQPNGGLVRAVDRGLAEATGDYVALLDADDEWPTDRLSRHVAFLEAHPQVGLVHGDMTIIDADGAVIAPSFFEAHDTQLTSGRVLGRLLAGNFVSGGACTFRASLLPAIHPIPDDAAYPDWWIAATVAAVAEIDHRPRLRQPLPLPRGQHGPRLGRRGHAPHPGQGDPVAALDAAPPGRTTRPCRAADLRAAYSSWEYGLVTAALGAGLAPSDVVTATAPERERSAQAAAAGAAALRAGDPDRAARLLLNAIGEDPWNGAARLDLEIALQQAAQPARAGRRPAAGHRRARDARGRRRPHRARPTCWRPTRRETPAGADATLVVVYDGAESCTASPRSSRSSASTATARPTSWPSRARDPAGTAPARRPRDGARSARRSSRAA